MACLAAVAAAYCSAKDDPSAWLIAATLPHIKPRKTFPPATPTILKVQGRGVGGVVVGVGWGGVSEFLCPLGHV
jgi:hypothetical protein